jgi:hypothetical protein
MTVISKSVLTKMPKANHYYYDGSLIVIFLRSLIVTVTLLNQKNDCHFVLKYYKKILRGKKLPTLLTLALNLVVKFFNLFLIKLPVTKEFILKRNE